MSAGTERSIGPTTMTFETAHFSFAVMHSDADYNVYT